MQVMQLILEWGNRRFWFWFAPVYTRGCSRTSLLSPIKTKLKPTGLSFSPPQSGLAWLPWRCSHMTGGQRSGPDPWSGLCRDGPGEQNRHCVPRESDLKRVQRRLPLFTPHIPVSMATGLGTSRLSLLRQKPPEQLVSDHLWYWSIRTRAALWFW